MVEARRIARIVRSANRRVRLKAQPGPQDQDRVEIELRIEGAPDVLRFPESVLLAVKQEIADRNPPGPQRRNHALGLVWRDDPVLRALKEDHWRREAIDVVDRRAVGIDFLVLRVGSDQPIEVAGLEFVGVARKGLEIADAVVAGARAEGLFALWRQCTKCRVTAGAAAADH